NSVVTLVGNAPGATSFEWRKTPNGPVIWTEKDLMLTGVTADDSGTYFLTAKSGLDCTGSGSIELTISEALPPLLATIDGNACEEGNLTLCAELIIGATYQWQNPQGDIFAQTQCVTIPNATAALNGTYTVTAFKDGCTATGSREVSILPPPDALAETVLVFFDQPQGFDVVANDSLVEGKDFTIKILENPTKGTVVYDGNGVFTYTAFPGFSESDHMTYEICYTDCPDLCDIAFVTFIVRPPPDQCLITSLISPNDDGTNDKFVVSCLDIPGAPPQCPLNRIVIFNQWGDKVFEAQPYNNDWQGTYEGEHLPDGTYFYIFECDPDLPAQKGFVMIYR
ncbi:MAG: gliding motility-associated C-terminal domain-containing protein, partial [Bacteroidota bacterium]